MYEYITFLVYGFSLLNYLNTKYSISYLRASNRFIVSFFTFFLPILGLYINNYIDNILLFLLYMQVSYYTIDLPIAIIKYDRFQIIHHLIGYTLIYYGYIYSKLFPYIISSLYFVEQGSVILLSLTLLLKYYYFSIKLYNLIYINYYLYIILLIFRIVLYIYIIYNVYNKVDFTMYIIFLLILTGQYLWAYNSFLSVQKSFYKLKLLIKNE